LALQPQAAIQAQPAVPAHQPSQLLAAEMTLEMVVVMEQLLQASVVTPSHQLHQLFNSQRNYLKTPWNFGEFFWFYHKRYRDKI